MANGWTLERRQKQAALIRNWRPWDRSTGPRTDDGKTKVSQNAYKGAIRPELREIARLLRAHSQVLDRID